MRQERLLSTISMILTTALLFAMCSTVLQSGRVLPNNPIGGNPPMLIPESLEGGGSLVGDGEGHEESTQPPEETTEPTQPPETTAPSEPPAQDPASETQPEAISDTVAE